MEENVLVVFHGFLNLKTKEKIQLVNEINNYFDSTDRGPIRADNETKFAELDFEAAGRTCKCCGRGKSITN